MPSLKSVAGLGEIEQGKALARMVPDRFVSLLSEGKKEKHALALVAKKVREECDAAIRGGGKGPVVGAILKELLEVAHVLHALADDTVEISLEAMDTVMTSTSGARYIVRSAIVESEHFRQAEAVLRRSTASIATLMPEVQQACKLLQTVEIEKVPATIQRLPIWRNALRPGTGVSTEV